MAIRRRIGVLVLMLVVSSTVAVVWSSASPRPHAFPGTNGRIAFDARDSTGASQIWSVKADGSGEQQVTTGSDGYLQPAWSPDGSKLAFQDDSTGHLLVANADGSGLIDLTPNETNSLNQQPAWSP